MRRVRNILIGMVWTILGIYATLSILLQIPVIQRQTGNAIAEFLCTKLNTKVKVGTVKIGLFNRVIIDDVDILDQKDKPMFHSARLAASIDLYPLSEGKISISSAQLFGLKLNLYQKDAKSTPNFQFVIDSLSSNSKEKSKTDLSIKSLIFRRGAIKFDRLDIPKSNSFSLAHVSASGISAYIILDKLANEQIKTTIKDFSLEDASGFKLNHLSFSLAANNKNAELKDFNISLPHSTLEADRIKASFKTIDGSIDANSMSVDGELKGILSVKDFAFIYDKLSTDNSKFSLTTAFKYSDNTLKVRKLRLNTIDSNGIVLDLGGHYCAKNWTLKINKVAISDTYIKKLVNISTDKKINLPDVVSKVKNFTIQGSAKSYNYNKRVFADIEASSNLGKIQLKGKFIDKAFDISLHSSDIDLKSLAGSDVFGKATFNIGANGLTGSDKKQIEKLKWESRVSALDFKGYTYKNITFNGDYERRHSKANVCVGANDPNMKVRLECLLTNLNNPAVRLKGNIRQICPQRLKLSDKWKDAVFSLALNANTTGKSIKDLCGNINISDFKMASSTENYAINNIDANIDKDKLTIISDAGNISIKGKYDFANIGSSLQSIVKDKIPSISSTRTKGANNFNIEAHLNDTRWVSILLGIPFHTESPVDIYGKVDDSKDIVEADVKLDDFIYDNNRYKNGNIRVTTANDSIFTTFNIVKMLNGNNDIRLNANASLSGNGIGSTVLFDYNTPTRIKGRLNSNVRFTKKANGYNAINIDILPSQILVKDTAWNVMPSNIVYSDSKIEVNHFAIEHNKQHIRINGLATKSADDSICVDLRNVNIAYILDLINFHSVEFSGLATGKAYLKSITRQPEAYATLTVNQFKFQDGRMGTLTADVSWNNKEKQIDIDAHADDTDDRHTIIKGYVSPERNYIDLGIEAQNTNIEFLQSFCGSFMSDIKAQANGKVNVVGDLSEVNLKGKLIADGKLKISTLNTEYTLQSDTIVMVPDEIIFNACPVTDRNGNKATVSGALHHKHLTRLTYDISIDAKNFLCYDFNDYGDNTFYGTVYGTGNCTITGRPHNIGFNIDMTPQKGSFLEYNAASPDAISDKKFLRWNTPTDIIETDSLKSDNKSVESNEINDASDIHMNVAMNLTPDFTLRVLMDKASGDYIALNGSGAIKATYFNKGSFDLYGTYLINNGTYKLTIQNIIKKDFIFQQGSSIVFGGNPYNARLDLKAVYPINGVSLADLKIGNSFTSNNVKVDCIMNIGGTPENIQVDFDFDMPTVNNDAKQMVRSLINSEEEMNQQVIYLLAIGRFYNSANNNATQESQEQSQTSLAMQSLLSGTISQQVNSILGSIINNNSWNFGTNISTGTEGFNNAEYEGILSGSLFSNRLLINGQFGYRDNPNTTSSFIGDFDLKYLLTPTGNLAIKVYNQTNDRYFTKSSLNTQGIGLIIKRDFNNLFDIFRKKKKVRIKTVNK